jgi:hypothetical protein
MKKTTKEEMASESLQQHRRFLAAVLNASREPLEAEEKALAKAKFYRIIDRYSKRKRDRSKYTRHLLIRYTYEYALSEESQIHFLQTFFQALELTIDGEGRVNLGDKEQANELWLKISAFADFLVDNFYLPRATLFCSLIFPIDPSTHLHACYLPLHTYMFMLLRYMLHTRTHVYTDIRRLHILLLTCSVSVVSQGRCETGTPADSDVAARRAGSHHRSS